MKDIKSITIFFENTDCINIKSSDIGHIEISNIYEKVKRLNADFIGIIKYADFFSIEIMNSANEFDEILNKYTFERLLELKDIVLISLNYDENNIDDSEDIYLPWKDLTSNGIENKYQHNTIYEDKIFI